MNVRAEPRHTGATVQSGIATSSGSNDALRAFDAATYAIAAHRPEAGPELAATLVADPDNVAGHAMMGFAKLMLARCELQAPAADALDCARAALTRRDGGTADERLLVDALGMAVAGSFIAASDHLDKGFVDRPAALLPFKLSHGLRFMAGDRAGMLARSRSAMGDLPAGAAGGFILGCHAFALEEHGQYDAAERIGRRAVLLTPEDSWGRHAVSHVHEMRGETRLGLDWLENSRRHWSRCNNFAFHMAWHLALLHLEQGDHGQVLAIYDAEIRPEQTDDYRDMSNAVSLLWRLQHLGVDVGTRWQDMAEVARHRQSDATLVFASLHTLCALVAIGDGAGVAQMLATLQTRAASMDDQGAVARRIGLPLARLLAGRATPTERRGLDRLVRDLPVLGGSNAQRDLFMLALADIAGREGDARAVARIAALRAELKSEDRLLRDIGLRAAC